MALVNEDHRRYMSRVAGQLVSFAGRLADAGQEFKIRDWLGSTAGGLCAIAADPSPSPVPDVVGPYVPSNTLRRLCDEHPVEMIEYVAPELPDRFGPWPNFTLVDDLPAQGAYNKLILPGLRYDPHQPGAELAKAAAVVGHAIYLRRMLGIVAKEAPAGAALARLPVQQYRCVEHSVTVLSLWVPYTIGPSDKETT